MAERPAVNASPLIFLSRADMLDMLKIEGERIVVPKTVAETIRKPGSWIISAWTGTILLTPLL